MIYLKVPPDWRRAGFRQRVSEAGGVRLVNKVATEMEEAMRNNNLTRLWNLIDRYRETLEEKKHDPRYEVWTAYAVRTKVRKEEIAALGWHPYKHCFWIRTIHPIKLFYFKFMSPITGKEPALLESIKSANN